MLPRSRRVTRGPGPALGPIERCIELLTDFLALCGPGPDASTVRGAQPVMVHVVVGQWEPVGADRGWIVERTLLEACGVYFGVGNVAP